MAKAEYLKVCPRCYRKFFSVEETKKISRRANIEICDLCYGEEGVIAMGLLNPDLNELEFIEQVRSGKIYPENLQ